MTDHIDPDVDWYRLYARAVAERDALRERAERAEAAVARVKALCDQADERDDGVVETFYFREALAGAERSQRRLGPTDDDLRKVAELYRGGGHAPVKAVRQHFDLKERAAYLWVARARAKGFL